MKGIILILGLLIIAIALLWMFTRAGRILDDWAAKNNYQILSSELRWLRRGPFFWTSTKNQIVYYVTVRTLDGTTKRGWVRCGSFWLGIFQNKAEVRWED